MASASAPDVVQGGGKSPAAFRTTSEVAAELDLPTHVLRFWEAKFPQIKPLKRGGGRRYYRPQDVDLLHWIRQSLYHQGYTIRGVQKLLNEGVSRGAEPRSAQAAAAGPPPTPSPEGAGEPKRVEGWRGALEAVRRDLIEIRALVAAITARDEPGSG